MLFLKKTVYFNKNLKVLKVVWNVGYTFEIISFTFADYGCRQKLDQ